jgi:hypothetical protein
MKAQTIQTLKDKKQNHSNDNFIIEYTSYNQCKHVKEEETKKEIVQKHINKKELSTEHVNGSYDKTNSKLKLIILTTGCFFVIDNLLLFYF